MRAVLLIISVTAMAFLLGCANKPVIHTQVIDRPVVVPCEVKLPEECKGAYAVDRVSPNDDMLVINRALRAEIEDRAACEVMLRAALKGCNNASHGDQAHN